MTVERQDAGSTPQIIVNGEAVRPRMFWGASRSRDVEISENWSDIDFDVSVLFDAHSTLHFRFGAIPGEVWLKDLRVTDSESGEPVFPENTFMNQASFSSNWNVYPPGDQNTVGSLEFIDSCLHVTLTDPPTGSWPDFHIYSDYIPIPVGKTYHYSCRARASSARNIKPAVYHVNNGWTYIGGPPSNFEEQIKMAAAVGVNFITFNVSNCWLPPEDAEDWTPLDFACQTVISCNPNALLIPRVSLDAPTWWLQRNPDAAMVYEDGSTGSMASISDRTYREEAARHLEKLCRHLAEQFPDNLAGVHPCGQNTGEWFYNQSSGAKLSGYDAATLQAWQDYSGEAVPIPTPAARRPAAKRLLLDPAEDGQIIAFNHFLQDEMADFIIELSDAARSGLGDDKLIMFFYGYHYELAGLYNSPAASGHYALQKILDAPNIDVLCSPISYTDRGPGESGPDMSSVESVLRAGKMWLNEDDTRTYLSTNQADHDRYGGCDTQEETQNVLLRNLAQSALRGYGSWWMDHGAGTGGGWFADSGLWDVLNREAPLDQTMLTPSPLYEPEIAVVLGENSMLHVSGGSATLGKYLVYNSRKYFPKSGTGFGQYMLQDLVRKGSESKLIIYLSAWALSADEREALIRNRAAGSTRVWFYAPGYIVDDRTDPAGMRALTGFEFREADPNTGMATATDAGRAAGLASSWGFSDRIRPLFTVDSASCTVLARYDDGSPAMAVTKSDSGRDIFVGVPMFTEELMRSLVRLAGITPVTTDSVLLWISPDYCALHGVRDGAVSLAFDPDVIAVQDAVTGNTLTSGKHLTLALMKSETRVLKMQRSTSDSGQTIPAEYQLHQNYPNPFNTLTHLRYGLPELSDVHMTIYDLSGRRVREWSLKSQSAGMHDIIWNGTNQYGEAVASGLYICRMQAGNFGAGRKMIFLK